MCGHQRVAELRKLGAQLFKTDGGVELRVGKTGERFAVRVVDWDEGTEKAANVTANNSAIGGEWTEYLAEILDETRTFLGDDGFHKLLLDEVSVNFDEPHRPRSNSDGDDEGESEPAPIRAERQLFSRGDVFCLGAHRLMCGDCTDKADREKLLGDDAIGMVIADPPYGISAVSKNGFVGARNFGIARKGVYLQVHGDSSRPDVNWLVDFAETVIIWGGNYFADTLPVSRSWLVWNKLDDATPTTYADCELAWSNYGGPARIHTQLWKGMYRALEHGKRIHPTQKPVALMEWCLSFGSGIVFDPYCGSGSVIIACEQQQRTCYAMEIEPDYCDLIVERWEHATGGAAAKLKP